MKHKLTSAILALALMLTLSVPIHAAYCRSVNRNELLRQLLCRYIGVCDGGVAVETPAEPETPAQSETSANSYEREVVRLVNLERAKVGLAALTEDAALTKTARMKSEDMRERGYFDHNSPTYGTPFQLMKSQGVSYRTAGENIAMGYATPEAVVNAWMHSPSHRANILSAAYTRIGVGFVKEGNYWTQHFTG